MARSLPSGLAALLLDDLLERATLLRDGTLLAEDASGEPRPSSVPAEHVRRWLRDLEAARARGWAIEAPGFDVYARPELDRPIVLVRRHALDLAALEAAIEHAQLGGVGVLVTGSDFRHRAAALDALVARAGNRCLRVRDARSVEGAAEAGFTRLLVDGPTPAIASALSESLVPACVGLEARDARQGLLRFAALLAPDRSEARALLETRACFERVVELDADGLPRAILQVELGGALSPIRGIGDELRQPVGLRHGVGSIDDLARLGGRTTSAPPGPGKPAASARPAVIGLVDRDHLGELTPDQLVSQSFIADRPHDFGGPTAAYAALVPSDVPDPLAEAALLAEVHAPGPDPESPQHTAHGALAADPEPFTATFPELVRHPRGRPRRS